MLVENDYHELLQTLKGQRMSTVYSANIRVEVKKADVEVIIFGELESVRLLDSYLRSRIGGLSKVEANPLNNKLEVITYEDVTGRSFERPLPHRP